ncbi:MAG: hypothetical protein V4565_09055 [Bacteroidota bacterium]
MKNIGIKSIIVLIAVFLTSCGTNESKSSRPLIFASGDEFAKELGYMKSVDKFGGYVDFEDCVSWWGLPDEYQNNTSYREDYGLSPEFQCVWKKIKVENKNVIVTFKTDGSPLNPDGSWEKINFKFAIPEGYMFGTIESVYGHKTGASNGSAGSGSGLSQGALDSIAAAEAMKQIEKEEAAQILPTHENIERIRYENNDITTKDLKFNELVDGMYVMNNRNYDKIYQVTLDRNDGKFKIILEHVYTIDGRENTAETDKGQFQLINTKGESLPFVNLGVPLKATIYTDKLNKL